VNIGIMGDRRRAVQPRHRYACTGITVKEGSQIQENISITNCAGLIKVGLCAQ
jgi:hypothetical protein